MKHFLVCNLIMGNKHSFIQLRRPRRTLGKSTSSPASEYSRLSSLPVAAGETWDTAREKTDYL